jgi:hypothetical protein
MDASAELEQLEEQRAHAAAKVDAIERETRAATEAAEQASLQLTEATRVGASASKVHALEGTLVKAQAHKNEPWRERAQGARRAVDDADRAIREHVEAHLAELVEAVERDGEAAARRVTEAAAELVAASDERRRVESTLGQLLTRVRPPSPNDVSRSRADEIDRAARALLDSGGESAVTVTRIDEPWNTLLAGEREPEPDAELEAAPV